MAFAVLLAVCLLRQFWVADGADFIFPAKKLTSFTFGAKRINIWASEDNLKKPSADWQFRYQPFLSPVFYQETNQTIKVEPVWSKWYTELILTLEHVDVNTKAFEAVKKVYKNVSDLGEDNVFPLGVRNITVTLSDLRTELPKVKLLSPSAPCPDDSTCFKVSTELDFRIILVSSNREMALNAKDFLERTIIKYDIALSSDTLFTKSSGELDLDNVISLSTASGVPSRQSSQKFIQNKNKMAVLMENLEQELERKFQASRTDLLNLIEEEINNKTLQFIEKTDELSNNQKKMELGIANSTELLRGTQKKLDENIKSVTGGLSEIETSLTFIQNKTAVSMANLAQELEHKLQASQKDLLNVIVQISNKTLPLIEKTDELSKNQKKMELGIANSTELSKETQKKLDKLGENFENMTSGLSEEQTRLKIIQNITAVSVANLAQELERKLQASRTDLLDAIVQTSNKTQPLIQKTDELSKTQKKMELDIANLTELSRGTLTKFDTLGENLQKHLAHNNATMKQQYDELMTLKTNIVENVGCLRELKTNTTFQQISDELTNCNTNLTKRFDHLANSTNTLADEVKNLKLSPSISKECPGNGKKFCLGGRCHCYFLINTTLTWFSAKQSCRNQQADLVSIHT